MPRTTPQNHELQPGCILWLPKKDEIDDDLLMDVHIGHGCFDHPVVVLSTNLVQGKATVFILTSFKGQSLAEKFPGNRYLHLRTQYLPIYPSAAHPDTGILLYLDNNVELLKKSYINTQVKAILNVASLDPHRRPRRKCKLKQSSYDILAAHIKCDPPTPQMPLRTIQHAIPQTPSTPCHSPIISTASPHPYPDSAPQRNTRAPLPPYNPPSRARPLVPHDPPSRARPLVPHDPPSSAPPHHSHQHHDPPSQAPSPEPFVLADSIPLLLLGSLGAALYWRHRLSPLGKWALMVVKNWKWRGVAALTRFLHLVGVWVKRLVLDGDGVVVRGLGVWKSGNGLEGIMAWARGSGLWKSGNVLDGIMARGLGLWKSGNILEGVMAQGLELWKRGKDAKALYQG